jgi:hypothetical protein
MPLALIFTQPRLQRIAQLRLSQEVNNLTQNDKHKRNRIHPMNSQMEDLDTNRDAPKAACQQRDIEEGRRTQPEQQRRKRVKQRENEGVSSEVTPNPRIPVCVPKALAIENAGLRAVDKHAPERQLAHDFVQRLLANQELFKHVAESVQRGAKQREQVAFDGVRGAKVIGARDVVGAEDDAEAADAAEDAEDLRVVVADAQEDEGDDYDNDNGEEVDELRGEDCCLEVS